MSLYNMIFGYKEWKLPLLEIIGVKVEDIPRYRDIFIEEHDDDFVRIGIYTRAGGGNRSDYKEEIMKLRENPHFFFDEDDDYDRTYATFWFKHDKKTVLDFKDKLIDEVLEKQKEIKKGE